jgi:hypothetical protein
MGLVVHSYRVFLKIDKLNELRSTQKHGSLLILSICLDNLSHCPAFI